MIPFHAWMRKSAGAVPTAKASRVPAPFKDAGRTVAGTGAGQAANAGGTGAYGQTAKDMVTGGVNAAGKVASTAGTAQQVAAGMSAFKGTADMAKKTYDATKAAKGVASKAAAPLAVAGVAAGAADQMFSDPSTGEWNMNVGQNLEGNANKTLDAAGDTTMSVDNAQNAMKYAAPTEWAGLANAYAGGLGDINASLTQAAATDAQTDRMTKDYDKRQLAQYMGEDPRATSPNPHARRAAQAAAMGGTQ